MWGLNSCKRGSIQWSDYYGLLTMVVYPRLRISFYWSGGYSSIWIQYDLPVISSRSGSGLVLLVVQLRYNGQPLIRYMCVNCCSVIVDAGAPQNNVILDHILTSICLALLNKIHDRSRSIAFVESITIQATICHYTCTTVILSAMKLRSLHDQTAR